MESDGIHCSCSSRFLIVEFLYNKNGIAMPVLGPNDFSCDAKLKPQHCFYNHLSVSSDLSMPRILHGPTSYRSLSRGPPHLRARSDPPKTLREAAESENELPVPSPSRPSVPRVATSPVRGRAQRSLEGVHDGSCRSVVARFTVPPGCFEPCQLLGKTSARTRLLSRFLFVVLECGF